MIEHSKIVEETLKIYAKCNVKQFPIDCIEIIQALKIPLHKYSDLSEIKRLKCLALSDDAFKLYGEIYYNDLYNHKGRQRFTIIHELGHIVLKHIGETEQNEDDANIFSSNFLAPRIMIHKYRCETCDQIHDIFGLSYGASNRALLDYKKWYENIAHTTRRPSEPERQLELLFFPEKEENNKIEFVDDEEIEYKPTPEEIYADIQRALKAKLPLSKEYTSILRMYRKIGLNSL